MSLVVSVAAVPKRVVGVVCGSGSMRSRFQQSKDGVAGDNEEDTAWFEKGIRTDHDPRKFEDVRARNTVSRVLLHNFGSHDWIVVYLYEASRVNQFQNAALSGGKSHFFILE